MPRIIAVEGPDGAGKSTLIQMLSADLDRPVIHTGGPPKTRQEWLDRLAMVRSHIGKAVLFDRLPQISEQVYGPLYDRDPVLEKDDFDRETRELDPVIVYCRLRSKEEMLRYISRETKAHKSSAHMDLVLANFDTIVSAYDRKMNELDATVLILNHDWQNTPYVNLLRRLKECAA